MDTSNDDSAQPSVGLSGETPDSSMPADHDGTPFELLPLADCFAARAAVKSEG